MAKIRLLIVEAREIPREGYVKVFNRADEFELVSVCSSYEETLRNTITFKPDIILVGIRVRGGDRIELTRTLKERHPEVCIILLVPPISDYYFEPLTLLKSEVDGFISGGCLDSESLFEELTNVCKGYTVVPPMLGGILREEFIRRENGNEAMWQSGLSRREQEVLSLVAKGLTNGEIADKLFITQNTVKVHLHNVLKKMKVGNRQQAVLKTRAYYLSKGSVGK